jgi:hypothetical protein
MKEAFSGHIVPHFKTEVHANDHGDAEKQGQPNLYLFVIHAAKLIFCPELR